MAKTMMGTEPVSEEKREAFENCYDRKMSRSRGSLAALKVAVKECSKKNSMPAAEIARLGFWGAQPYDDILRSAMVAETGSGGSGTMQEAREAMQSFLRKRATRTNEGHYLR